MVIKIWNVIIHFSLLLIMLSVVFCFIRMVIGPVLPDRVIALDLTANLLISFIAIFSVMTNQPVYIDVVIALALIIFLTTVAFANLITWQSNKRKKLKIRKLLNEYMDKHNLHIDWNIIHINCGHWYSAHA